MDRVLALALEALSGVERQKIHSSLALTRSGKQLAIHDPKIIAQASFLVRNVLQRKNFIDRVLRLVLAPAVLDGFSLGNQSFLRIFVFKSVFAFTSIKELIGLTDAGRAILGWRHLMPVEKYLGTILNVDVKRVFLGLDDLGRISLETYHPEWFVRYCIHLLGRSAALKLLKYSTPPPRYVAINTLKGSEEATRNEILASGVALDKIENIPHLYRVTRGAERVTGMASYVNGLVSFQDVPSSLAVLVGAPRPGHVVLEIGLRPISKTRYLAQLMENTGKVISIDSATRRMERFAREVKRTNVVIVESNGAKQETQIVTEKADLVLLSPPCSDTGVFWRDPSLKWRVDFRTVVDASHLQWKLLTKYANNVRDGGSLIYWTTSITLEENELLIERFLRLYPEFSLVETHPRIGVSGRRGQRECQRLYPHLHAANSSYFAKLKKCEP